jgi:uncharacterized repeat protein (TIGR01451 family)
MQRRRLVRLALLACTGVLATTVGVGLALGSGVDPATVTQTLNSGSSTTIQKTVHTPAIPPKPDVMFLADTTSSMSGAIGGVQAQGGVIMSTVLAAQPLAEFGVSNYTDQNCPNPYVLDQSITASTSAVQTALNGLTTPNPACNTDAAEDFLNALFHLATDSNVGFRTDSTRVVVLFGDSSSHDPSAGHTLAQVQSALLAAGIKLVAVNVPGTSGFLFDGLDHFGQASALAAATGGVFLSAASAGDVSNAILQGLHNLPVTVTHTATCDAGLSATFDVASKTVTSGADATFMETLTVAPNAADGGTLHCSVDFLLNGLHQDGFQEAVNILVPLRPADLSLDKTVSPTFVTEGNPVTYTFSVTNHGTDPDANVTVTETLPAGTTFASGDPGCTFSAGTVTCLFGTVAAGATVSKSFVANVAIGAPSSITNTATVTGQRPDPNLANNTDSATLTVNHNPVCTGLTGGPQLWPPNHKLVRVTISGATDPDNDVLTTTVNHVTQDEPLNALGDGNTSPDAMPAAASNQVWLRAERSGLGDGRVYRIAVTVTDGKGGSCTGTPSVGVPHDQGGQSTAVDSGQLYTDF